MAPKSPTPNVLQLRPIEKFWANLTATIIDYKLKLSFQINNKIFRSQPQSFAFQFDAHTKPINPKTTYDFKCNHPFSIIFHDIIHDGNNLFYIRILFGFQN
jgi:hypothetical protein